MAQPLHLVFSKHNLLNTKINRSIHHSLFFKGDFAMLQKMTRTNEKGFTLIELMIVIAIIGILAAIAIPNFIAYRNKAFCSAAEADANSIAGAIANWFAIPSHTAIPTNASLNLTLSGTNTYALGGTVDAMTVTVTDGSGRCPADYRTAATAAVNAKGYWSGQTFVKLIQD
jgi:prepilin-type N-terminal cleavage/methylation domain-containing protein